MLKVMFAAILGEQAIRGQAAAGPGQDPIRHSIERFPGEIGWLGSQTDVGSGGESVLALVPTWPGKERCVEDRAVFPG